MVDHIIQIIHIMVDHIIIRKLSQSHKWSDSTIVNFGKLIDLVNPGLLELTKVRLVIGYIVLGLFQRITQYSVVEELNLSLYLLLSILHVFFKKSSESFWNVTWRSVSCMLVINSQSWTNGFNMDVVIAIARLQIIKSHVLYRF